MLHDDLLAEPLEPDGAGDRRKAVVALPERLHQAPVALVQPLGQPLLQRGEERPAGRGPAQRHEPVVRDADERRGEHGDEPFVVVAVVQQAEVAEQVDDLLLAEVAATGRPVRRQVELAERLLVLLGVGAGGEEQHDLARLGLTRVDQLLHPAGDRLRLPAPPGDAGVLVAPLVGDEQLDRRPRRGIGEAPGRDQTLELVAERGAEQLVDHREHLRPRPPVLGERQDIADRLAPLLEDLDVGVPEAVDRLELVADEEELVAGDQVDHLALEPVRVLELVDADLPEAQLLLLADPIVVAEQVPRAQLEILEVERRFAVLRRLVRPLEGLQELLEERAVAGGDDVQRRLLQRLPRLLVVVVALDRVTGEVEQRLGHRPAVEQLDEAGRLVGVAGGCPHARDRVVEPGRVAERQLERPARGAQRLVDAGEHPPERRRTVGGEQAEPVGLLAGTELGQRLVECLHPEHGTLALVQHPEAWVEPGGERVLLEQPQAEAVDRRDPRAVKLAHQLGPAQLAEPRPDPAAQLGGGPLGVRDHQDRADVDAAVDRAGEPLDEHGRLPRAGAGRDEDEALRLDRGVLLGGGRALGRGRHQPLLILHIEPSRHHDGHVPSRGSCLTSPSRMRATIPRAPSCAFSIFAQKSSSST